MEAMTNDEYRKLIAFLGTKFGEVDANFRAIDARFGLVDASLAQIRAEMHEFRHEVDGRFRHVHDEMDTRFEEVKGLIRVRRLEGE